MTYEKLPIEFKKKWVKALRGKAFKQCIGRLRKDGGYCCPLGVACEITNVRSRSVTYIIGVSGEVIPLAIQGKSMTNPIVDRITMMNDEEGKSLLDIATWIEENL